MTNEINKQNFSFITGEPNVYVAPASGPDHDATKTKWTYVGKLQPSPVETEVVSAVQRPVLPELPAHWTPEQGLIHVKEALAMGGAQADIAHFGLMLVDLLLHKNSAYGNSALEPVRVWNRDLGLSNSQEIGNRMNDKVTRIANGVVSAFGESPEWDLAGYVILKQIAEWKESNG